MNKQDLKNKVSKLGYLYSIEDVEGGVLIYNKQFKTNTFIPDETIQELGMRSILQLTNQGKNVEHITRVTGYFSKVEHWNKGKQAEFKERYRSKLDI